MGAPSLPRSSLPDLWRGRTSSFGRDRAAHWQHLDLALVATTLGIAALGILMVFSASRTGMERAGLDPYTYIKRQALFLVLGLVVMGVMTIVEHHVLRDFAAVAYLATTAALVAVLSPLGTEVNGSQSWFALGAFQLQPAEVAKLAVIVTLAAYCASHRGDLDGGRFLVCLALTAVPVALIFLQPDVGSALVFIAILAGVLLVAGARPRHLAVMVLAGVVGVIGILQVGFIEDYQRERLTVFADEGADTGEAAYQLDQSKTAIGAGGLTGSGLFEGTQTKLRYVPKQQTDFIFTVVGEELGFAGSATLLLLYGLLVWRIWRAARVARDVFGTLVCVGILAMVVSQVFQNMGMTMGIMPISGIPLPFMSYGGSSTLTMFAAMGVVLNVNMRRFS